MSSDFDSRVSARQLQGHLTEEQLRQDVGIVAGFTSANPALFQ
jgi:hypothetical protein